MVQLPKLGFSEIFGEARFFGEYLRFRSDSIVDAKRISNDDWRPVLLIPGFMAGDASLYPLGARLRSQGHQTFYAGIWMNADCPAKTLERLRKRIREVSLQTGRKVVIIGHSLGGIYARELARIESESGRTRLPARIAGEACAGKHHALSAAAGRRNAFHAWTLHGRSQCAM